ncbi:hypothetical protein [Brevibacillus sp. SYSU BS000544]|uniref:hypothetical protein n=1 Tax=Brevibacillus sp. SYSU BS000544 TaxID=3416443 RepID=UPI003CE47546
MMSITPCKQTELFADTVIKLADAFGMFATFYSTNRYSNQYVWDQCAFSDRRTMSATYFFLSLHTSDGRIGQALGQGMSQSALENAFHLARHTMQKNERLTTVINHLQKYEQQQKIPPITTPPRSGTSDVGLRQHYIQWEAHHREAAGILSHSSLRSSLETSTEYHYSLRTDGVSYSTVIQRLQGIHQFEEGNRRSVYTAGYSTEFDDCHLVEPLIMSMNQLLQQEKSRRTQWISFGPPKVEPALDATSCLVIDSRILAHFLFARIELNHPIQNQHYRTNFSISPLEGTLGYNPFHPFGYIIPLSKHEFANLDFDPLYQTLFSQDTACFGNHAALDIPALCTDDPVPAFTHPQQLVQVIQMKGLVDDEPVYFLQGVQAFRLDKESATCAILPDYLYKFESGQLQAISTFWLMGEVNGFISQLIGGLGPDVIEYAERSNWSVSLPQYAVLHLNQFQKEKSRE